MSWSSFSSALLTDAPAGQELLSHVKGQGWGELRLEVGQTHRGEGWRSGGAAPRSHREEVLPEVPALGPWPTCKRGIKLPSKALGV